jgi:lysozyme
MKLDPTTARRRDLYADISIDQAVFSPRAYMRGGSRIVALKATQGYAYIDAAYRDRVTAAHDAGLRVIHYHYANADNSRSYLAEAGHFTDVVTPNWRPGDLSMLDFEQLGGLLPGGCRPWAEGFDQAVWNHAAWPHLTYSSEAFYQLALAGLKTKSRLFVLAAWGSSPPKVDRGDRLFSWQYTDGQSGPAPHYAAGVSVCDMNLLGKAGAAILNKR